MSDINAFYTTQAKTSAPAQGPVAASSALAGGNGLFGAAGAGSSFFDLIFALTSGDMKIGKEGKSEGKAEAGLNMPTAPATDAAPAITDLSAALDTALSLDVAAAETDAAPLPVTIELDQAGQKKFMAALENLLRGLPADQQNIVIKIAPGQIAKALNLNGADKGAAIENLIATGLNPEQMTALMAQIAAGKEADLDATAQAFLIGIVKIMPDGSKNEAIFLPRALVVGTGTPESDEPNDELAASLGALLVNGVPPAPVAANAPHLLSAPPAGEGAYDDVLKMFEQGQARSGGELKIIAPSPGSAAALAAAAAGGGTEAAPSAAGPVNTTFTSPFAAIFGSMMSSSGLNDTFPEGMDWSQNAVSGLSNTQVTGTAQLASLVTQAQHASQPHAATQLVAASLIKSAQSGEAQTLKLQLNPPELGRIEVHMHFTKDKTMKAHMVIEKPETMLMLQRDAQVLERALQEAGMDSGGNNLSFELSNGQNDFGNNRNGSNSAGPNASSADDGVELIETTMTWYVDSETGQQHYNILV